MSQKTIYQADKNGFFLYEDQANAFFLDPTRFNIPYLAYEEKPPATDPGYVARRKNGEWIVVEDHRADVLYVASTGEIYTIDSTVEIDNASVRYDGGGPIPPWLTPDAPQPPLALGGGE